MRRSERTDIFANRRFANAAKRADIIGADRFANAAKRVGDTIEFGKRLGPEVGRLRVQLQRVQLQRVGHMMNYCDSLSWGP